MDTFEQDLTDELKTFENSDISIRVKKGLFIVTSNKWNLTNDLLQKMINELINNIGGVYRIDTISNRRAVVNYAKSRKDVPSEFYSKLNKMYHI